MAKIVVVPPHIYGRVLTKIMKHFIRAYSKAGILTKKHKRLDILLVKGAVALTQILITVKSKACN